MPYIPGGSSRRVFFIVTIFIFVAISLMIIFRTGTYNIGHKSIFTQGSLQENSILVGKSSGHILGGPAIAPKLANETAKAELGRAAWKLFHTTFARFPDKPSEEESQALKTYIQLFARLYPCGECASHFQQILKSYPPQVKSRSTAAVWGCHVHNEVNKSLGKEIFDCSKIGDFYHCGCADEGEGELNNQTPEDQIPADELSPVELKEEGLQRGG